MTHDESREKHVRALLTDALARIRPARTVHECLSAALASLCDAHGWPIGHAWVLAADGTGDLVPSGRWHCLHPEEFTVFREVTEHTRLAPAEGLPGRVLATAAPQWVDDVALDPNFPRAKGGAAVEVRSGFAVPVVAGARVVAVLEFFALAPIVLDAPTLEAITVLGHELGAAIERHWSATALRESESRFRAVAFSANDAIITADPDGRIAFWNRAAEAMFGFTAAEVLGQPLTVIIPAQYRAAHERGMARIREGGTARVIGNTVTLEGLRRDGTVFPVELSLARWQGTHGEFFTGIIRDVSERQESARRLAEAHEELARRHAELERRNAELDADLREASQFQRAMLPSLPASSRVRGHAVYEPADAVGGDLYDVALLPDGRLRVFLADTVGHGVQASLRTMVVKTLYERHKTVTATPAELLARVNADTLAMRPDRTLRFSACCFDLAPSDGDALTLRVANAAQLPLVLVRDGAASEVYQPSPFIGASPDALFSDRDVPLRAGDRLLAYTDGLVEQWSPDGTRR